MHDPGSLALGMRLYRMIPNEPTWLFGRRAILD